MSKKIIGLFVCMLLLAPFVPARETLQIHQNDARHPTSVPSNISTSWIEEQKLLASDGTQEDHLGTSISFNGDSALIGVPGKNNARGAVYIFTRSTDLVTWEQQAKLTASDGQIGDNFGSSVCLFGDTALIGALDDDDYGPMSGSAYVFTRTGNTWTQQKKLHASDAYELDQFGSSVSLFGDIALIGAPGTTTGGAVYVFTRAGSSWTQQTKLTAPGSTQMNFFGSSISLEGDTALIGDAGDHAHGTGSGAVYVFTHTNTSWTQQSKLLALDGAPGDYFGSDVALSSDTALIGAMSDDDNGNDSGSAYIFTRNGTTWAQQAKLLPSDGAAGDKFSWDAVAFDGDTALIGASNDDDYGVDSGSAYVFTRNGTTWTEQQKLHAKDGTTLNFFGSSVALKGNTALIGATGDDDNGAGSGSTYVFAKVKCPFLNLIHIKGGLLKISVDVQNFGNGTIDQISWEMNASGGRFFYPRIINGTAYRLSAGESETIDIKPVLGLGNVTMTLLCKYRIVNLSYNVDFVVKQKWRNRALLFLVSYPKNIQPKKQWMVIENYSYFNSSESPGVALNYEHICNMHNVRVVFNSSSYSQDIEFIAACKFTNGSAILYDGGLTKSLEQGGAAYWEVELFDGR